MVPDSHKDLLEEPVYSILTTINPDGEPENPVIWASSKFSPKMWSPTAASMQDSLRENSEVFIWT
ncbi:MAG: hypothetical protein L0154_30395 [Chloroflexi bacterium]|nr:hypothetical protein [Chloroflexota bacterium]